MSNEPLTFALARPSTRRDIALAVVSGISPAELAEEFSISSRTVRAYAAEWRAPKDPEPRRVGARKHHPSLPSWPSTRWERELGPAVVRELLGLRGTGVTRVRSR
ncbi:MULTISPECIES: ECF-type sigma factor [Mycobacteroides]|nr:MULTISPECIES: ECF-type sigma factor [Mycobacteroides]MDB2305369.1 helix-turn-helix domain-containing protein [Mycobacteroides abscessus subsp. massiliense]MDM2386807.1 helix-turn-helix domain-containing protein [Mycobacteroides abscessus]MDM2392091.1 helix-turn-helix domain-containing protein [Mycobacteroides abscessus]MDO2973904.1 helix-turn-helix domain-containing protein [Mycobacteroides abscessus subsp. massiliense]MDO3001261.1 helix-turn-helix domain-containing protein [Mycobacteroides